MLANAEELVPPDEDRWPEFNERVLRNPERAAAIASLEAGNTGFTPSLVLEGPSHADCLVECERTLIWIEGKRTDWLSPSTTWDATRDQLARNLEAAWLLADKEGKDYCFVLCYESELKHHERVLIDGYRAQALVGGWPHLDDRQRAHFAGRIGTVRWAEVGDHWSGLQELPELADLDS
jgi:hypothetical protein